MLTIKFHNDGTGDKETGNYNVAVWVNLELVSVERTEGHKRADGWRALVKMLAENEKGPDDGG